LLEENGVEDYMINLREVLGNLIKNRATLTKLEISVPCLSLNGDFEDIEIRANNLQEIIISNCLLGSENLGNYLKWAEKLSCTKNPFHSSPLKLEIKDAYLKNSDDFEVVLKELFQPRNTTGTIILNAKDLDCKDFVTQMLDFIPKFEKAIQFNLKFLGPNLSCLDLENIGRALEQAKLFTAFELECADGNKLQYNK